MKSFRKKATGGFTLVELLVVIAIIGVMLSLAANVLQNPGKERNVTSGVQIMQNMIQEARATAIGNDTCARVVIACDEDDTSRDSIHLRYVTVQMYVRDKNENRNYDGTDVVRRGEWVSTSSGTFLPAGVYFCPTYSRELQWMDNARDTPLEQDTEARLSGHGLATVYYIEFDEKGRFVTPDTKPGEPSRARRLVLIGGHRSDRNGNVDGIIPSKLDKDGHPAEARGIVLWPSGNFSVMKTLEQVYDPEVFVAEKKAKSKSRKGKKNNKKDKKDKDKDDAKKKK
ncbi:MAG: prepilin-type N-terminal cleavage/methylation domain-containing protein [Akkermansiaceae bacterium]|nr:prepilin-type N-terminal cleavage/methylation domain-containing protein [Akkermansiaceae bacterium]